MAEKELTSLKDFNEHMLKIHEIRMRREWNGIACPECGAELYDEKKSEQLLSSPPQIVIACEKCSFRGYRFY